MNEPVDYEALAALYPSFAPFVRRHERSGRVWVDFHDEDAVRELTFALLRRDHTIDLQLPRGALCPMLTVRLNYVRWIERLVGDAAAGGADAHRPRYGIDIGTGASAIYALLACRRHDAWRMLGTDIDTDALDWAQRNVDANGLADRVRLVCVSGASVLRDAVAAATTTDTVDFIMCNPPFYTDAEQIAELRQRKRRPPHQASLGRPHELVTSGGEIAFVSRMIDESAESALRHRVRWFTAKLGIRASLAPLQAALSLRGVSAVATTTFRQGRTRRWAIAWSFVEIAVPPEAMDTTTTTTLAVTKRWIETIEIPSHVLQAAKDRLLASMQRLHMTVALDETGQQRLWCRVIVPENTWNRRGRRKCQVMSPTVPTPPEGVMPPRPLFELAVRLIEHGDGQQFEIELVPGSYEPQAVPAFRHLVDLFRRDVTPGAVCHTGCIPTKTD